MGSRRSCGLLLLFLFLLFLFLLLLAPSFPPVGLLPLRLFPAPAFGLALLLLALWLWSVVAKPKAEVAAQRLHPETLTVVAFVAGAFLLYLLLYGWYRPVGKGDRFMLSLYAPLAVCLIWGAESIRARIERRGGSPRVTLAYFAIHLILACMIVARLVQVSFSPAFFTK